jgi:hypothetical protein
VITFKDYLLEAKSTQTDKVVAKLEDLNKKIGKWAHTYDYEKGASSRMYSWMHQYDDIKVKNREAWDEFCKKNKFAPSHNARDLLA